MPRPPYMWEELTVLPDVHADGVGRGDVGVGGLHGGAGGPHVEEEEDWYRREAEDGEEGQEEDVGQEHELRRAGKGQISCWAPFLKHYFKASAS